MSKDYKDYRNRLVVHSKAGLAAVISVGASLILVGGLVAGHFAYKATHPVEVEKCVVTFHSNGGSSVAPIQVEKGKKISKPLPTPTRADFNFVGWFDNPSLEGKPFDYKITPINTNLDLYASWLVPFTDDGLGFIKNPDGKSLAVYCAVPSKLPASGAINIPDKHEDPETKVVMPVTSLGYYDYEIGYSLSFANCTNITEMHLPDSIEIIETNALYGCSSIKEIKIPSSTKVINSGAFYGCTKLETVGFSNNKNLLEINGESDNGAFSYCTALKNISLPSTVLKIGEETFSYCTQLNNVALNNGLMNIGEKAFYGCSSLEKVEIPASTIQIDANAFYNCECEFADTDSKWQDSSKVVIDNPSEALKNGIQIIKKAFEADGYSLCYIGKDASDNYLCSIGDINNSKSETLKIPSQLKVGEITFNVVRISEYGFGKESGQGSKITDVIIPASVKTIGAHAFDNCTTLTSVTFENDSSALISIGDFAFKSCHALKSFDCPTSLQSIGNGSFYLSGIENIGISASVAEIKNTVVKDVLYAPFYGCSNLKTINCDSNNQYYASSNDKMVLYAKKENKIDTLLKFAEGADIDTVNVENGVTTIGAYAFYNAKVKTVVLPYSLTIISDYAFASSGSNNIVNIKMGPNVLYIGDSAFAKCKITEIELASELLYIGNDAFNGCSLLKGLNIPSKVNYLGNNILGGCSKIYTSVKFLDNDSTWMIVASSGSKIFEEEFKPNEHISDAVSYLRGTSFSTVWYKNIL